MSRMQQPKALRNRQYFGRKNIKRGGMRTQLPPLLLLTVWPKSLAGAPLTWAGDSVLLPLLPLSLSGEAPQNCQLRGPHHPEPSAKTGSQKGHTRVSKRKWKEEGPKTPKSSGNSCCEYTHDRRNPCADIGPRRPPWQQRWVPWEKHTLH